MNLQIDKYRFESKPMQDLLNDIYKLDGLNLDSLLLRAKSLTFRSKSDYVILEELDRVVKENEYLLEKRKDTIPRNTILFKKYIREIKKLEEFKNVVDAKKYYLQQSLEKRIFVSDSTVYSDYWASRGILPQLDHLVKKVEELEEHIQGDYNFLKHINQIKTENHRQQEIIDILKGNYNQDWISRLQSASEKIEEMKDNKRFLKELLGILKTAACTGYLSERFRNSCLQDLLDDLIELVKGKINEKSETAVQ